MFILELESQHQFAWLINWRGQVRQVIRSDILEFPHLVDFVHAPVADPVDLIDRGRQFRHFKMNHLLHYVRILPYLSTFDHYLHQC